MQEDAAMKRDMFLAEYRAKVDAEKESAQREATKNDVTAQFTDPETGSVYGRTKSGGTVPLMETSPEYRQSLRDKSASEIEYKRAQRESAEASAARARRPATVRTKEPKEPKPDPIQKEIRAAYMAEVARLREARVDDMELDTKARANLYPVYGGDAVSATLGGSKKAAPPAAGAPQSLSPTQPNAPSMEEIIANANKAVAAGADPAKVEARMAQLMQQYGYTQ
jgi:hypothetical protein